MDLQRTLALLNLRSDKPTHARNLTVKIPHKAAIMPPEKGWRKKIHDRRPKTPVPPKTPVEDAFTIDEPAEKAADRLRVQTAEKPGWMKQFQGRPVTPLGAPASFTDDLEDSKSEYAPENSPRRKSAPTKLSRYFSHYNLYREATKEPDFSEPWSDDAPFTFEAPVDPVVVIESVHHAICSTNPKQKASDALSGTPRHSQAIPVEHNSEILRVFEDYRKIRGEKERLECMLQETLNGYRVAEESWETKEGRYQEEIKRLELIIARGTSGMVGLMKARQGSVVERRRPRPQRRVTSTDGLESAYDFLSREQLDDQIRMKSQQATFYRPTSPSGTMAALSRDFSYTGATESLPDPTPPRDSRKVTLSRKVKSELDLFAMGNQNVSQTLPHPDQERTTHGRDATPVGENKPTISTDFNRAVECEAFVALKELAILVARRKGMNAEAFADSLMRLYDSVGEEIDVDTGTVSSFDEGDTIHVAPIRGRPTVDQQTLKPRLRHFQSEPHLTAGQYRRRHFSFEPGDDFGPLSEDIKEFEMSRPKSPAGSQSTASSGSHDALTYERPEGFSGMSQTLITETLKPSKIPSPVQGSAISRVRREDSTSSLRTISAKDDRRNSRSSVLTAFRHESNDSLVGGQHSTSRSNSISNLRQVESRQGRDRSGPLRPRDSVTALAAARAADRSSNSRTASRSGSQGRDHRPSSTVGFSNDRMRNAAQRGKSENVLEQSNATPQKRY